MGKFQISTLVEEMYTNRLKYLKAQNLEAVSQNFWRNQKSGKMRRNHDFKRIKAGNWEKVLLKAEKEHQNRKSFFRQTRIICAGIYMQVWGNHLKNKQTQSKRLGVKPDGASALVWGAGCCLVHIYCFIFEPYRGTCGSTKSHFWEN